MKVWAIFGIRQGEMYEDPGAKELVALHETEEAARAAVASEKAACAADPYPNGDPRDPFGYDDVEIEAVEVKT